MTKYLFSFFIAFTTCTGIAQSQVIKGTVTDSSTNTTMAFVSVLIKETNTGTLTDIDGHFSLNTSQAKITLVFSYTGYAVKEVSWSSTLKTAFSVALNPDGNEMETIIISNKENPAFRIIRNMQAKKKENDPEQQSSFSYNAYTLAAMLAGKRFWHIGQAKPAKKIAEKLLKKSDTARKTYTSMMASRFKDNYLFVSEAYSKRIYKNPGQSKETVLATKFSGFKEAPLAITATNFQPFGFYNDYIYMNNESYLSPVANGSIGYYQFDLKQILPHNGDTIFVISFRPRDGKNFNGLKGLFYINSDNYAIQTVSARAADEAKRSMVFSIQQKYEHLTSGWFPVQLDATLTQKDLKTDSILLSWDSRTYITNVETNVPLSKNDFTDVTLTYAADAGLQKDSIWNTLRPDTVDTRAVNTYKTYELLPKKMKLAFNGLNFVIKSFTLGAIPLGKVNLPLNYFICGINRYEIYRFGAGIQTNSKWNKTLSLGGYAGYGLGDKSWKYGGNITIYTKEDRNSFFALKYKQDLQETGIIPYFDGNYSLASFQTVRNFLASRFDSITRLQLLYSTKLSRNLSTDLWINKESRHPAGYLYFYNANSKSFTGYHNSEAGIGINYHKGETYTKVGNAKVLTGLAHTQIQIATTQSLPGFFKGQLDYTKIAFQFTQRFRVKRLGKTTIDLNAGKIWGNVPYGQLFNTQAAYVPGGISYIPFHFQSVGLYEFSSDAYAGLFLEHNFGHLLFKPKDVHFQPEFLMVQNIEYGALKNPEFQKLLAVKTANKGLFESGFMVKNVYRHSLLSTFYLGVGGGVFYRYGSYALPNRKDNLVFKFGLNFSQ